jgi:uncharacterized membrane protein YhaH (DUF805 family)
VYNVHILVNNGEYVKKYFSSNGRDTRSKFWLTQAIIFVLFVVTLLVVNVIANFMDQQLDVGYIFLILFIKWWAIYTASVRRLRDSGNSEWIALLTLIPGINVVVLIACGFLPSKQE